MKVSPALFMRTPEAVRNEYMAPTASRYMTSIGTMTMGQACRTPTTGSLDQMAGQNATMEIQFRLGPKVEHLLGDATSKW